MTICICTRDRGASIAGTLESIASSSYANFDIVVVDQSLANDTEQAVREAMAGPRLTYIRSRTRGLSVARNLAVANARGDIVAFTDDDCEVSPEWLTRLVGYFSAYPRVGQICGEVRAAPHAPADGFIPTYGVARKRLVRTPWLKWREGGIGANMAFRRAVLEAVGPFDELLGAGGILFNCEDGDMTYRVLRAGHTVLNVPDAFVVHHGQRTWAEGRLLMRRTGFGVGAAYMKHLRLGDVAILPTLLVEWARSISWKRLWRLQRHAGIARFLWYARGMSASLRYRIDRRRRVYLARERAS